MAQTEHGLTTCEITERLQISRQATYHPLHTLLATGVLTRDEGNRYLLGLRVATLGNAHARASGKLLLAYAQPDVERHTSNPTRSSR